MRRETIKLYKSIAREEHKMPSPKIFKSKKTYDRKKNKIKDFTEM